MSRARDELRRLRTRIVKTGVIYGVALSIGCINSLVGVTLLDLQAVVGVTLDEAALLFTYMSLGRIAGAVIVTRVLDDPRIRLTMEQGMAVSMVAMALSTAAVPHCKVYGFMAFAVAVQGAACGHTGVATNVACFRLWGTRTPPVLQGMALGFSVGLSMAPALAMPFICLSPNRFVDSDNQTADHETAFIQPELSYGRLTPTPCCRNNLSIFLDNATETQRFSTGQTQTQTVQSLAADGPYLNDTSFVTGRESCAFHWPYIIMGIFALTLAIILLYVSARDDCRASKPLAAPTPKYDVRVKSATTLQRSVPLFLLFGFLYLCLANIEITFGALILSFCVHQLQMTKASANVVTLVYWVANMTSRVPSIFISRRLSPAGFLGINTAIICVTVCVLAIAGGSTGHRAVLWVCSAGLGVGCATAFANGLTLANQCTRISSRFVSLLFACHSVGSMSGPAVAGLLFRRLSPMWFLYYLTWWALLMLLTLVAIQVYRKTILRIDSNVSMHSTDPEIAKQLHQSLIPLKDFYITAATETVI